MFMRHKYRTTFRLGWFTLAAAAMIAITGCAQSNTDSASKQAADQIDNERMERLELMNQSADMMYEAAKSGRYEDARESLMTIAEQVVRLKFDGITSVEGVQQFAASIVRAKETYNAVALKPAEAVFAAGQIRLAADALTHKNNPLWLQYHKILQEDLNELNAAVKENRQDAAEQSVLRLKEHYSIIRPAVWISRDASVAYQADMLIRHVSRQLSGGKPDYAKVEPAIESFQAYLDELFLHRDKAAYLPVSDTNEPLLWTGGLAAIIISVLAYVGWRKYQPQRDYVSVRRNRGGGF